MIVICMILLVFFGIIGLCSFIAAILDIIYRGEENAVLTLYSLSAENAEARIRSAARICQRYRGITLRCVCKEDDPAYDICKLMEREYTFMQTIPPDKGESTA